MKRAIALVFLLFLASCQSQKQTGQRVINESLDPVRPGARRPGHAPFWNAHAKQFIYAPAFDFKPVEGANWYHFIVRCSDGTRREFNADDPWADLSPVWRRVPPGATTVYAEVVRHNNVIALTATRAFHRASVFHGPYGAPVVPYNESARVALASVMHEPFVRSWLETGKPDPNYALYRYASKIMGSLMSGCAMYAQQVPRPEDADDALKIGRASGDYLISISAPAGTPLEYFPPTYHNAASTERENDHWTMLMTPAEAGNGFVDLYEASGDEKYLIAAKRIADTYGKCQLPSGTWYLKVDNTSPPVAAPIELIPSVVVRFLDRLATKHGDVEAKATRDRAVAWIMANPMRTMNWAAQFDDAKVRGAYENLSKHEACEFANYLFEYADGDRGKIELAQELVRWAEDQFVTWEDPPGFTSRLPELAGRNWFTPCSLEQYAMFEPISGSSAFMMMAYLNAYRATGDRLYLLKAQSLGNALTEAQAQHNGRYPTRMIQKDLAYWINSTINTVRAMKMLADAPTN